MKTDKNLLIKFCESLTLEDIELIKIYEIEKVIDKFLEKEK